MHYNCRIMHIGGIGVIDLIIITLYLAFIIWWGLRNGKSSNAGSYFLAGRGTPWYIIGLSLFAASISSTTLIGQTGDAYATGIAVFNYNLTGVWVLVFFAVFLLPLYIKSRIFTIPEFLEKRFDSRSRYYFSAVCILGNIFLDAAGALYSAALILRLLFPGVDLWIFVLIFAVIAASYTIPGGLSAAINTDLIQAVILLLGSLVMMIICYAKGGGEYIAGLIQNGDVAMKLVRPLTDSSTPWLGLLVGMPVLGIYFWANNQTLVQRVLSAKSVNQGRLGVMLAGFLTLCTLFIFNIPGVIARKFFPGIENPDMIYPTMVIKLLPAGVLGLMLSAMLAALTSTLSAILNSASTLFTMDFYAKIDRKADQKKLVRVGKISALAIIVIATLWAPNIEKFGSLLKYYQEMLSYISPPIVATFLMGIFVKRTNARGAFAGLLSGLALAVVLLFRRQAIFGDMHFLFIVPILLVFSMLVIWFVSIATGRPEPGKLVDTTFSIADFKAESLELKGVKWWKNYRFMGSALIILSFILLFIFR